MTKERFRMAVATHLLLHNARGEVLFMRRAGTGYADGQWSVPAGHVEYGETLAESCVRESAEEIGVFIDPDDLEFRLVQHKHDFDGEERIDVFFAADLPADVEPRILEPHKCDALAWHRIGDLPTPTVAYVAAAIATMSRDGGCGLGYFGFPAPPDPVAP